MSVNKGWIMDTHVMLDLETLGTHPGCVVLSIGAQAFQFDGTMLGTFYNAISIQSSLKAGLKIEPATLEWWFKQSDAARAAVLENPEMLMEVIYRFNAWFLRMNGRYLWCHGLAFDEPIWRVAAQALNWPVPWNYRDVRDTRTFYDLVGFDHTTIPLVGVEHHAEHDATHQAECLITAYRSMK